MIESNDTIKDSSPSGSLTVGQLRELVREEVERATHNGHGEDHLLTTEEASRVLCVSPDWLYRHANKLPFTRKLGPKMLRFSQRGIEKWLATRKIS